MNYSQNHRKNVSNEEDPYSIISNVNFDYILDKKKTYSPIGQESKNLNSSTFNGVFLPGHNALRIRQISSIRKEGDEILVDVLLPDVEEPRTINADLVRQLCPDKFIEFLLENLNI